MEKFLLIVKREKFIIFKPDKDYELQYVNGEPFFCYEVKRLTDNLGQLLELLAEEYNLNSASELQLCVIGNNDDTVNKLVINYLQSKNILQEDGFISIESLLGSVYNELYSQANMLIDLYGINYDGINYHIKKEKFTTENFKLLAYTLQDKDVIEAFQRRKNDKM